MASHPLREQSGNPRRIHLRTSSESPVISSEQENTDPRQRRTQQGSTPGQSQQCRSHRKKQEQEQEQEPHQHQHHHPKDDKRGPQHSQQQRRLTIRPRSTDNLPWKEPQSQALEKPQATGMNTVHDERLQEESDISKMSEEDKDSEEQVLPNQERGTRQISHDTADEDKTDRYAPKKGKPLNFATSVSSLAFGLHIVPRLQTNTRLPIRCLTWDDIMASRAL